MALMNFARMLSLFLFLAIAGVGPTSVLAAKPAKEMSCCAQFQHQSSHSCPECPASPVEKQGCCCVTGVVLFFATQPVVLGLISEEECRLGEVQFATRSDRPMLQPPKLS